MVGLTELMQMAVRSNGRSIMGVRPWLFKRSNESGVRPETEPDGDQSLQAVYSCPVCTTSGNSWKKPENNEF
jgi:hypothetical protein